MRRLATTSQAGILELGDDLAGQVPARRVRLDDRKGALDGHGVSEKVKFARPYAMGIARKGKHLAYKAPQMLAIDNIMVRIAGREILSGATANLPAGRRIGLVGRNGAGKSTLFKVILGQLHQDDGEVSWPSAWRVGAVAQEAPGTDTSLLDTVLEADPERTGAAGRSRT